MMFCDNSFKYNRRPRKIDEGGYVALNTDMNTSMLCLKSGICLIINSSMNLYLYHADNDVLWPFFQIRNNLRPRKSKQGWYEALTTDINTSVLCLKIETNLIIIFYKIFYLCHNDNDVLWSFFQIQNKWRTRKLKEGGYGTQHVTFEI